MLLLESDGRYAFVLPCVSSHAMTWATTDPQLIAVLQTQEAVFFLAKSCAWRFQVFC